MPHKPRHNPELDLDRAMAGGGVAPHIKMKRRKRIFESKGAIYNKRKKRNPHLPIA